MIRTLWAVVIASIVAFGCAHAYLASSSPADGEVAEGGFEAIDLEFTEGIEVGFSTFKLVRIVQELDMTAQDYSARLNAIAGPLVPEVLGRDGMAEEEIAVTITPSSGSATALSLRLTEPLPAGAYLLAWRVLSVDTHVLQDFMTFTVR